MVRKAVAERIKEIAKEYARSERKVLVKGAAGKVVDGIRFLYRSDKTFRGQLDSDPEETILGYLRTHPDLLQKKRNHKSPFTSSAWRIVERALVKELQEMGRKRQYPTRFKAHLGSYLKETMGVDLVGADDVDDSEELAAHIREFIKQHEAKRLINPSLVRLTKVSNPSIRGKQQPDPRVPPNPTPPPPTEAEDEKGETTPIDPAKKRNGNGDHADAFMRPPPTQNTKAMRRAKPREGDMSGVSKRLYTDDDATTGQKEGPEKASDGQGGRALRSEHKPQQSIGIERKSFMAEDVDALYASQQSYLYPNPQNVRGGKPRIAPVLSGGYKTVFSDHRFTIFVDDARKEMILAASGTDDPTDLPPDLLMGAGALVPLLDSGRKLLEANSDAANRIEGLGDFYRSFRYKGYNKVFTGHSLGAAISSSAYLKFAKSDPLSRYVGIASPWAYYDEDQTLVNNEDYRVYSYTGDPISYFLYTRGKYAQPRAIYITTDDKNLAPIRLTSHHKLDTLVQIQKKHDASSSPDAVAVEEQETHEELKKVEDMPPRRLEEKDAVPDESLDQPMPEGASETEGATQTPAPKIGWKGESSSGKTADAGKKIEDGTSPMVPDDIMASQKNDGPKPPHQVAGVGVAEEPRAAGDALGTFRDVVDEHIQEAVNAQFHAYGKAFLPYMREFIASGGVAKTREQTGAGRDGIERIIRTYGSELPVEPWDMSSLSDDAVEVIFAQLAAIVHWYNTNPDRHPARAMTALTEYIRKRLLPPETTVSAAEMTDDQLLASAMVGAVVRLDPTTPREEALRAVKSMVRGGGIGGGGEGVSAHPSGAATGQATEAAATAEPAHTEPDPETFRLDLDGFVDRPDFKFEPLLPHFGGLNLRFDDGDE